MQIKHLALVVAALPVLAAPLVSHADDTRAVNACVQTFLDSDLAKNRKVTVQTFSDSVVRPIVLSGLQRIEVVAKGRESGKRIAHIVCHADSKGTIIAVNGRPSSAVASVAAR